MGSKHNKKRFFIVNYKIKPDGQFDELVELSKKNLGSGKIANATVILDLVNKEVIKCTLPNTENMDIPFENLEKHYRRWYDDVMTEFLTS